MGPSQFNLKIGTLEGPDIKWKIFRFIGNFSTSENFPTHLILLEKFPPSQFDLKIGTLKGPDLKWKIFRFIGNFSTSENFPIHLKIGIPQAMCTSGVPRELFTTSRVSGLF